MFGLGQKKIQERRYYPMVISEKGTEEKMSPEEDVVVWDAFEKLSQEKREVLLSSEMSQKIKLSQEKFGLPDIVTGNVSLFIRKIFFEEVSLSDAETSLRDVLSSNGEDPNKASAIVQFIQNEILTIKPKPKVEEIEEKEQQPRPVSVRLPLLQALSKYEQLGNQLITQERIKLRSQTETVRPSLLYWIKYYRDELGVGHHSTVDRGNFLFRSENGKKLTPEERERVNLVLKSLEENYPVEVDSEQSVIIFPSFVAEPAPMAQMPPIPPMAPQRSSAPRQAVFQPARPVSVPAPSAQPGSLTFTSSHVMPGEREAVSAPKSAPPQAPVQPRPVTSAQKTNPFHIRPVSLGKEE